MTPAVAVAIVIVESERMSVQSFCGRRTPRGDFIVTEMDKPKTLQTTVRARAYASAGGYARIDARIDEHRRLYNAGLEHRIAAYKTHGESVSLYGQMREFTGVRADDPDGFGAEDRRLAHGTLDRLKRAYDAFFRRAKAGETPGFPRFKSKGRFRTLEIYSGANRYLREYDPETGKGAVRIKGLPAIRFRDKRVPVDADGKPVQPKRILITRTARLMRVCMSFENGEKPPASDSQPSNPVGIDAGVNKRAAFSDGRLLPRRKRSRWHKRHARKMQRQREAAQKDGRAKAVPIRNPDGSYRIAKDGERKYRWEWEGGSPSKSYQRTRARYATELYRERVANRQALHRAARAIVDRHDFIAVEDLEIPNMVKSARGTAEEPGKRVAQKRGLNRSINEQNWGELAALIESKAESAGVWFARVAPKNTSLTCSVCGAVDKRSRRGESYDCVHCGYAADADVNAAVNILARGLEAAGFRPNSESTRLRGAIQNRLTLDRAKSATAAAFQPPLFAFADT